MKDKIIGYATGVFDLFHIGHLNILKKAKENCDYLIVGVTTDEITFEMKKSLPIIPFDERLEIVNSIKYVAKTNAKSDIDNIKAWEQLQFNVFFREDDRKEAKKGKRLEKHFSELEVHVVYFPYIKGTSSMHLKKGLRKIVE